MTNNNTRADLRYLNGFGSEFQSESIPEALPLGRNSPQRPAHGLFVELVSGTAFTAPRAKNRRTWMYRTLPSAVAVRFAPNEQPLWTNVANDEAVAPDPMRWRPTEIPADTDFIDGLRAKAVNGDPDLQVGMAALIYVASKSMVDRVIVNTDAEMLIVPQLGSLLLTTELGLLEVRPREVSIIPRGMAFSVGLPDGQSRGYVCENFGSHFRLPELGPIGSNGLANARDFQSPVAACDSTADRNVEIIRKCGGRLWTAHQSHSPFNVVAWHGNLVPYKYDTARFMTIGTISYDHPDPSIFTVLTSPSDTAGVANCDFVIFPPRWLVARDTFRPPWFHRNVMSEFMISQSAVEMAVPCRIGDYTDFYTSIHHATSVGKMFRPDAPLLPNYKWIPIGYHGRSSSIGVSDQKFNRPVAQVRAHPEESPSLVATRRLDFELELGVFIGSGNAAGDAVPLNRAEQHAFGVVLLNDWAARDVQAWEYQPLGPFLSKNFATTISPWMVTMEALAPFRTPSVPRAPGDPEPLPYLTSSHDQQYGGIDTQLEVWLDTPQTCRTRVPAERIVQSSFAAACWTLAQMITHHTVNGCNLQPGDLLGTGTQSGPLPENAGSLLELSASGKQPLRLHTGESRTILKDGDAINLKAFCAAEGARRIGFGDYCGQVLPATTTHIVGSS